METTFDQERVDAFVAEINNAVVNLQQIAEDFPQSIPGRAITEQGTVDILQEVTRQWKSRNAALGEKLEQIEAARVKDRARSDESEGIASLWHEKNEELVQRLESSREYAEKLQQRDQRQTRTEQDLKDGQRKLKDERARSKDEMARLKESQNELGRAQERLTIDKQGAEKTFRTNRDALDAKREELDKIAKAHDLKVAQFESKQPSCLHWRFEGYCPTYEFTSVKNMLTLKQWIGKRRKRRS